MAKRARVAKIEYREYTRAVSEYVCPFCRTKFVGAGIHRNITRFLCEGCKNEIIVKHNYKKLKK